MDDAMGISGASQAATEAWERTIEDLRAMGEQRREDGWEVVEVVTVHTSPVGRDHGSDDRFGLVHVVPDNHADAFTDAFERGEFTQFEAYRNEVDGYAFHVIELIDPDAELVVLLAGNYDLHRADGLVQSAVDEGATYTHAKTIDGTHLGSVRHEEYEPLLPDPDAVGLPGEAAREDEA